jgi:hypothetical protein
MPRTKTNKKAGHNKQTGKPAFFGKLKGWWERNLWNKIIAVFLAAVMLLVGVSYGIAQWYIHKHAGEPLRVGATFIPDYARQLGLEPEQTMDAIINDLQPDQLRLVSYWENGEAVPGTYDFTFLDWQMEKAKNAGIDVSLAIGLRQPRWPECHMPGWAKEMPKSEWEPKLKDYIKAVVERYRGHPALMEYQLENEFFLTVFGDCPDHTRERLVSEYELVKSLDPDRTLVVSRSNNALGWPVGEPQPDVSAVSVYKRVWDKTITKRYFEYPFPAWFYGFLAGWYEINSGKNTFIHELQAEAWLADGYEMHSAPIDEFYKSLNPQRLHDRFEYGRATGIRRMDLWGAEWWYYMKEKRHAPELWEAAKEEFRKQ